MTDMQGGETRRSERQNAQRHGFNSESERRSRRVADTNDGQNNGENTQDEQEQEVGPAHQNRKAQAIKLRL